MTRANLGWALAAVYACVQAGLFLTYGEPGWSVFSLGVAVLCLLNGMARGGR